jgi:predicted negative regulator of RcsB-dependent stress response
LGRYLTEKGRYNDAITILDLNAAEYLEFWMTFDGLGDAHFKTDNKEEAIKNYKRSLELNPDNTEAVEMLKKIKEK